MVAEGRLYIGNRRYSSWSMRGWLAVRLAGLDVEEVVIPLGGDGQTTAVKQVSPSGLVPYLEHRGNRVWETLAICEYCAEIVPPLWPSDPAARAQARSIAAEMHAGFRELRLALPMNLGRARPGQPPSPAVRADIGRIETIWRETREKFGGGPYLFGPAFTAADAMYAPVVARFLTYRPEIDAASADYCAAVRAHPLVERWYSEAAAEPAEWRVAVYEQVP